MRTDDVWEGSFRFTDRCFLTFEDDGDDDERLG